jgi:MraZ protein
MLSGEYGATLDDTGRIALPCDLRGGELEKGQVVLTKGPDSCLWLYPVEEWKEQERLILTNTNRYSKEGREIMRNFIGPQKYLYMDKQWRILIPPTLRDHAGLSKNCIILGQYDYVEIWADDRYRAHMQSNVDVLNAGLEKLGAKIDERDGDDAGNNAHSGTAGGNHAVSRSEGQG